MILVTHPTGNENVRQLLRALREAQLLGGFLTAIGQSQDSTLAFLPGALKRLLERRRFPVPSGSLHQRPVREAIRLSLGSRGGPLTRHETGPCSVDGVYRAISRSGARLIRRLPGLRAVYAYDNGALELFEAAKQIGLKRFYELPIAYGPYGRQLMEEEAERLPEWRNTLHGLNDSPEKLERKVVEAAAADVIIVPSGFVERSLPESLRASKPVRLLPYGADSMPVLANNECESGPLRVLFVGSLSQRKGLADLFNAVKLLNTPQLELHVLGSPLAPMPFYRRHGPDFVYHPPRARSEVLELMRQCDVFCLPTILEGRALVQLEALGCGLPLIVTPNAGGEDLIDEGRTGFLVPIRSPEAIADRLQWFLDHRAALPSMRDACRARAEDVSWEAYRRAASETLRALLC